jgi:hypothetical protein
MSSPSNLSEIIVMFINIGLILRPFLGAVAFLAFVLGVARFIRSTSNEKEMKESKNLLIWGIIGMFVLITVWGIIAFLRGEFYFDDGATPVIPQIRFSR